MKENNDNNNNQNNPLGYLYAAIVAVVLSAVSFGLAFTFMGIYALIASVLFELAALSFVTTQKKRNDVKGVTVVKIAAYVMLGLSTAMFVGGAVFSSLKK